MGGTFFSVLPKALGGLRKWGRLDGAPGHGLRVVPIFG